MTGAFQAVTQWAKALAQTTDSTLTVTPGGLTISKEECEMRILRAQNGDLVWAIQSNTEPPLGGPLTYIRELTELRETWELLISCPKE